MHEFIFAGGTIGNKFVSKFKMSLWEKMLLSLKTAHLNFTLIRLNNKSSPQFIRLDGTKSRLSQVIVHFILHFGLFVDPRGTRKAIFFCRSATRTSLRIFRVIIYRNVAMLLKPSLSRPARAGTRGMSMTQLTPISIAQGTDLCLEHANGYQSHARLQVWRENRHKLPNGRRNMFIW